MKKSRKYNIEILARRGSLLTRIKSFARLLIFVDVRFSLSDTCMKFILNDLSICKKKTARLKQSIAHTKRRFLTDIILRSQGIVKETQIAPKVPPAAINGNSLLALRESTISFARVQNMRNKKIFVT